MHVFSKKLAKKLRIGDRVELFVKPIAKAMNHPCLDGNGQLKPNSPCAKRRDFLNGNGVREDAQPTRQ